MSSGPREPRTQFGVFAKYWRPGAVKTRLAKSIGDTAASQIYRHFLTAILGRFDGVCHKSTLSVSPVSDHQYFRELPLKSWKLVDQGEGDLGTRMRNYFACSLSNASPTPDSVSPGNLTSSTDAQSPAETQSLAETQSPAVDQVLLIGSDSPNLPMDYVSQAIEELRRHDVVLGPTEDGGYYLIGMRTLVTEVFDDIAWSTESVWDQTTEQLKRHKISFGQLPTWYDVDNHDDLQRLRRDLETSAEDSWLAALAEQISAVVKTTDD